MILTPEKKPEFLVGNRLPSGYQIAQKDKETSKRILKENKDTFDNLIYVRVNDKTVIGFKNTLTEEQIQVKLKKINPFVNPLNIV